MTDNKTYMTFPCHFPIKIIGKKTEAFFEDIAAITRKHFPETRDEFIKGQESLRGQYLSITVTVYALDQVTLDALYGELSKYPDIKLVL